jgi:hypothetical protein
MSADVRAAVLLDPAGGLVAASGSDRARGRRLGELTNELVLAADSASSEPTAQIEAQVPGGGVFAVRDASYTLACVTKRLALPALVLYDMRMTMLDIEPAS